jgi:hypothetical protein
MVTAIFIRATAKTLSWLSGRKTEEPLQVARKRKDVANDAHIKELESMGFEWVSRSTFRENCLSELADYRKIHPYWTLEVSESSRGLIDFQNTDHTGEVVLFLQRCSNSEQARRLV